MRTIEIILLVILYVHQTFDIIGIRGYVDRPKLKSPDTIGWGLLTCLMILYFLEVSFIPIVLIALIGLVLFGFYQFHWKLFWFGATEQKIKGYNEFFKGTHRIMKESDTRLVPDTYHIIHTFLYVITFLVLVINQIYGLVH